MATVAEFPLSAFSNRRKAEHVEGRLVVRTIPKLNPKKSEGRPPLLDSNRFHALLTASRLDTVTADKTHRAHAIVEQINADVTDSALANPTSRIFTANTAWPVLATIVFNMSGPSQACGFPGQMRLVATKMRPVVSVLKQIESCLKQIET